MAIGERSEKWNPLIEGTIEEIKICRLGLFRQFQVLVSYFPDPSSRMVN